MKKLYIAVCAVLLTASWVLPANAEGVGQKPVTAIPWCNIGANPVDRDFKNTYAGPAVVFPKGKKITMSDANSKIVICRLRKPEVAAADKDGNPTRLLACGNPLFGMKVAKQKLPEPPPAAPKHKPEPPKGRLALKFRWNPVTREQDVHSSATAFNDLNDINQLGRLQ